MGIRRKKQNYTVLGKKIARLAKNQSEIAQVLELTQQSVSAKLCGKVVWLMSDLEKLAGHYSVPLLFFCEESITDPEVAKALIPLSTLPVETLTALAERLIQRQTEAEAAPAAEEPKAEEAPEPTPEPSESKGVQVEE
jgi:hypothetical protein